MSKLQVKKSNFLVPLEDAVSKPAQLLASYIVASLPKSHVESDALPQLKFPYTELRRAINADGKERINKIQDMIALGVELQKCILFYEDNVSERTVSWLIDQERNKLTNQFTYTLHPGLRKYLLNLENHFTKYNYLFRVCLNAHAMKLYEILKMYQYKGEVVMNIEEDIKPSLGLSGRYPKIYDLKRRVLNVAQIEIQQYTDISFEYEVAEKKRKTPISFKFRIIQNKPTHLPPALLDKFKAEGRKLPQALIALPVDHGNAVEKMDSATYAILQDWGGKEVRITALIQEYGIAAIEYQIAHLKRNLKSGKTIEKPFAWFIKALKEDYKDAIQHKQEEGSVRRKKQESKQRQLKLIEQDRKDLLNEFIRKRKALCDAMIKKHPALLDDVFSRLREKFNGLPIVFSSAIKSSPRKASYSVGQWYEEKSFVFIQVIQEMYPEQFAAMVDTFRPKVETLNREIQAQGGVVSTFKWK